MLTQAKSWSAEAELPPDAQKAGAQPCAPTPLSHPVGEGLGVSGDKRRRLPPRMGTHPRHRQWGLRFLAYAPG
jgi:hypothetical protein